jgi:hypothetical protein
VRIKLAVPPFASVIGVSSSLRALEPSALESLVKLPFGSSTTLCQLVPSVTGFVVEVIGWNIDLS